MQKHRILSLFLAAALLVSSNVTAFAYDRTSKEPPAETDRVEQLRNSGVEPLQPDDPIDPAEEITVIVKLSTRPVVSVTGSGARRIRNQSLMLSEQRQVQSQISSKVLDGEPLEVLESYTAVTNSFAARVPYGKLDDIRALPDVAAAYPAPVFKVAPDMPVSTTELGGLENSSGYLGEGMVIAIVDTGLEVGHSLFRKAPSAPALDEEAVAAVLADRNLKAEDRKSGITASQVYRSAKVPFAFDYADKDLDVAPGSAGDHGVHVSGIAAGNQGVVSDVAGTAPQAQILAMKVFSSSGSNGATWTDILAAADDAVMLGADVINMSLGSTCGFSTPEGDQEVAEVFENIAASGVLLSVSAGNEYSAALGTRIGKGHALTANPDYGTVASPSSYGGPLSVASVEKADTVESCYLTVGDRRVAFNDTVEDKTAAGVTESSRSFRSLAGGELEYVVVPNAGETKDYDGLDVRDRIALVSRGSVEYNAKKEAAKAAGAAGILVYNNEPGMLYMQLDDYDLPSAFISQADGKALAAVAEGGRRLTVSDSYGRVENPTSGEMSDFSSWGVTPELTLKPDITAPGGNIKSATVNDGYTTKSGTSMSAPFVSGAMAVTKQYVEQKDLAESETDKAELVSALLMSTADPVMAGAAPYSPRKQGAGSVNIAAATSTRAYLTAPDGGRPKVELGDDPQKTGEYTVRFQLHNLSGEELTYTVGGYIQTDGQEVTKQLGGRDVRQVTELPYLLGRIGSQIVTVPGGGTADISVKVTLTDENKSYLDSNFENGTYVEGFVTLTPESAVEPVLSIPYMGFYGDWTQAPIVDATDYGDKLNGAADWSQAYVNTAASSSLEGTVNTYLGDNPYHEGVAYLADRSAISPNGDGYMDTLSFVYTGLLRNVRTLHYEIKDADSGEIYYDNDVDYETKSVYSSNYYQIVPAGASDYDKFSWDGTKKDHSKVPDGTKAIVTVSGTLAYDAHEAKNAKAFWSFPITIDTEEPEIRDVSVRSENGKYFVDLTVRDDQFVSNVTISNSAESKELASFPVAETEAGKETKCSYDITGFGENLKLVVNDYACNRKVVSFKAEGNTDASEIIVPTRPIFTEDFEGTSFPPEGWSVESHAEKTWHQATEYGSKVAMVELSKTEQQDEWLITPAINLKEQTTRASMIFDFYTNYYWSVQNHHHNLKVMASADGGAGWEQIWQLWDWNQKNEFGAWEKTQAKVTIPDKYQDAQSVKFAFVYEGKDSTALWLDNVQVYVEDPDQIHTITASAGAGGSIDPSGSVQITDGRSRTFTITPDAGHFIQSVTVDGENKGTPSTYTFSNVKEDHTIQVAFGGGASGESELLIDEDFNGCTKEGALPAGWTASGADGSSKTWLPYQYPWSSTAYTPSLGAYRTDDWKNCADAAEDDRLLLPAVDMSGRTGSLSFRIALAKTYHENGNFYCALEGSADGSNWTQLWVSNDGKTTYSAASGAQIYADVNVLIPTELQKSGLRLAFRYHKNAGGSGVCSVDDVKLVAVKSAAPGGDTETTLLDENFDEYEGGLPTDWTIGTTNSGYTWKIKKNFQTVVSAYCDADIYDTDDSSWWSMDAEGVAAKSGAKQDERLITPALAMNGRAGTAFFQFSGSAGLLTSGAMTVTLEGTVDDGAAWVELWNAKDTVKDMKTGVISGYVGTADIAVSIPEELQKDGLKLSFHYQRKAYSADGGSVYVDNVRVTAVGGGSSENPPQPAVYTITASAGQGGSISPSGSVSVNEGESRTFTVTPSEGYEIEDVTVDGESVGKRTSYTFENVAAAHTIAASFTEKEVTLPESIHEDFNNSEELPAGWTVEGPSARYYETWKIGKYSALNRSNAALCTQNIMFAQEQNELLLLPQIHMQSGMALSFDFGGSYAELSGGQIRFTVQATGDKGQTWTELWNAKDHLPDVDEDSAVEDITGKGSVAVPSAFCVDGAQLAFVFESSAQRDGNGTVAVDNVVLAADGAPAPELYGITVAAMNNGSVTADRTAAAAGDLITLTVRPDAGYHLKDGSLMANDQVVSGNTFTMPAKEVVVSALFEKDAEQPGAGSYRDGVYTGSAQGRNGTVAVRVTVENGVIAGIEVTEQKETGRYWEKAKATIQRLLGLGDDASVDAVDTKTGATISSDAIKQAVQNALKNAAAEDSGIFDGGSGSKQSPYRIGSIETLTAFAASVNGGEDYESKYVALACDLDLSGRSWTPIGVSDHGKYTGFAGIFDGCGYTVSHISCGSGSDEADHEAVGFFGVVDGGTVRNLNLSVDKYYNSHDADGETVSMGGLTGILARNGVIDHCSVSGGTQVLSETSGPRAAVGGLAGRMESGAVIANSWTDVGLNYGSLDTDADVSMGGICGLQAQDSLIANSASFGSVPGMIMTGALRVGGLVGQTSGAVYNCFTTSLTKANVMGRPTASGFVDNDASTAVGHLIGSSVMGAALYHCYYDKNADQFSNVDLAGDPSEGKTERRQAAGWDSGTEIRTDLSHVEGMTASELTSEEFADTLNANQKYAAKRAADAYFAEKDLLNRQIAELEDRLDGGFRPWELTDGRALFGDETVERVSVTAVELLEQRTVPLGTSKAELDLPKTVEVTLSDRTRAELGVTWTCGSYDGNTAGSYRFEGALALADGITNPRSLKAYVVVNVEAEDQPVTRYRVTVSGGSGSGSYAPGDTVTIRANAPASGYAFNGWTVSGAVLADASAAATTFVMPAHNVSVSANWKRTGSSGGGGSSGGASGGASGGGSIGGAPVSGTKHDITSTAPADSASANGTVTAFPANAAQGSRVTLTVSPDRGYALGQLMVTDAKGNVLGLTKQSDGTYTFIMPDSAVTVQTVFAKEGGGVFADVPGSSYCADAVNWAVENGITNGKGGGVFGAGDPCSRAQIVTFLWRAAGSPDPKMTFNPFRDMTEDTYYYKAVLWAVENGVTGGTGDGLFSPDSACTRGQSVTLLHRAAGAPAADGSSFADVPAGAYCTDAVQWAVENGITQGTGASKFSPDAACTRAQIVTFLYRQNAGK